VIRTDSRQIGGVIRGNFLEGKVAGCSNEHTRISSKVRKLRDLPQQTCVMPAAYLLKKQYIIKSRDSSVGITTGYGLDDQGGRDFESI
jgi:hypothetical protein